MHLALDAVSIVAAPWSGRIAARHGARTSALVGFALIAAAWTFLAVWHGDRGITLAGAALALSGYAVAMTGLYNLIIESTPPERTGESTGMTYVFFTAFFAVGAQIVFALLQSGRVADPANSGVGFPSDGAYVLGFVYIAATGVLGFLLATQLPRRDRVQVPASDP
jgi:MFS family permease